MCAKQALSEGLVGQMALFQLTEFHLQLPEFAKLSGHDKCMVAGSSVIFLEKSRTSSPKLQTCCAKDNHNMTVDRCRTGTGRQVPTILIFSETGKDSSMSSRQHSNIGLSSYQV